jgi:hypothetical protein
LPTCIGELAEFFVTALGGAFACSAPVWRTDNICGPIFGCMGSSMWAFRIPVWGARLAGNAHDPLSC